MHGIPLHDVNLKRPANIVSGSRFVLATEDVIVPDGVYSIWITAVAQAGSTSTAAAGRSGANGGTGGWVQKQRMPVEPGQRLACTITSALTSISNGEASITLTAGANGSAATGGAPGTCTIVQPTNYGLVGFSGTRGHDGVSSLVGPRGGSSPLGIGGAGRQSGNSGEAALGYGASGGASGDGADPGGASGPGAILLEW